MKNDNIVTLNGENGETLDFYCDAKIPLGDYVYEVLRPVKKFEGLDVQGLLNEKHVIFDVKCTLDRCIVDGRL